MSIHGKRWSIPGKPMSTPESPPGRNITKSRRAHMSFGWLEAARRDRRKPIGSMRRRKYGPVHAPSSDHISSQAVDIHSFRIAVAFRCGAPGGVRHQSDENEDLMPLRNAETVEDGDF
jgi:hypothetical protein